MNQQTEPAQEESSPYLSIARVAHETQRTVEASQGNHRTPVWDVLTEAQKSTAFARVKAYIETPDVTPVITMGPTTYAMDASERAGVYAFYGVVRAIAIEQSRD